MQSLWPLPAKISQTEWDKLINETTCSHYRTGENSMIVAIKGHYSVELFNAVHKYMDSGAQIVLTYYDAVLHQTKIRLKTPDFKLRAKLLEDKSTD